LLSAVSFYCNFCITKHRSSTDREFLLGKREKGLTSLNFPETTNWIIMCNSMITVYLPLDKKEIEMSGEFPPAASINPEHR